MSSMISNEIADRLYEVNTNKNPPSNHTKTSKAPAQPDPARAAAIEAYRRAHHTSHLSDHSEITRQPSRKHRPKTSEGSHLEESRRGGRLSRSKSFTSVKSDGLKRFNSKSLCRSNTSAKTGSSIVACAPIESIGQIPCNSRPLHKARSEFEMPSRRPITSPWTPPITTKTTDSQNVRHPSQSQPDPFTYTDGSHLAKPGTIDSPDHVPSPLRDLKTVQKDKSSLNSTLRSYKSFTNAFKKKPSRSITSITTQTPGRHNDASLPPFNFAYDADPPILSTQITPDHSLSNPPQARAQTLRQRLKRVSTLR